MKKRGMSEVVSTVLIILITVSGAALLASIIIPYVNNKLDSGTECQAYNLGYFQFDDNLNNVNYNCYIKGPQLGDPIDYGFSIRIEQADERLYDKVSGFNILFRGETASAGAGINDTEKTNKVRELLELDRTYSLVKPGETITYVYQDTAPLETYDRADVYTVLKSGKVCDVSDSIPLRPCLPGVDLSP